MGTADNGYMRGRWLLSLVLLSACGEVEAPGVETSGLIRADNDLGWKGWCYTGPDTLLGAFPGVVRHEISHALSPRLDQRFDHNAMCLWFSDPADFVKVRVCQFERDLTHD
jgi:hypothetical protein